MRGGDDGAAAVASADASSVEQAVAARSDAVVWRRRAHAAAIASALVAADVMFGGLLTRIDAFIAVGVWNRVPALWRTEWAAGWLSRPGDEWWLLPVLAGAALALAQKRGIRLGVAFAAWGLGGAALAKLMKTLVGRTRPYDAYAWPDAGPIYDVTRSAAFPSGHTVDTTVVYAVVAACAVLLAAPHARERVRRYATAAWLALAVVVGCARILGGLHWPSDVIAGWALGLAWLGYGMSLLARFSPDVAEELLPGAVQPWKTHPNP